MPEEIKQIKCSKCKNKDLAFISGPKNRQYKWWHNLIAIILTIVFIAIVIIAFITKNPILQGIAFVISVLAIAKGKTQPKLHTKAVCKNCGHIEYLD